jgi:hypothetical protein
VLRLAPGCILAGRVLESDGTPAQRVEVSTARWLTETDERGEFWMHDEPSGRVLVHATDLATGRRASCAVELAPGRLAELELRLPQLDTVRIRGRITRGGRPAAGSIALRSDAMKLEAETDEDGGFELRAPSPGAAVLWVWQDDPERACRFDLVVPRGGIEELVLELDGLPRIDSLDELDW